MCSLGTALVTGGGRVIGKEIAPKNAKALEMKKEILENMKK
jgi:hypothetical protein